MRSRLLVLAAGLAVLLAGAIWIVAPFLVRERDYAASIPQPYPLVTTPLVVLGADDRVCMGSAVIDEHSEEARFRIGTYGKPGSAIVLDIRGVGYRERVRIPGRAYTDNTLVEAPVDPPARATEVRICLRNAGPRRIALYASDDRTRSRSDAFVNGEPSAAVPDFAFYEREPRTLLERLPLALDRMDTFRPGLIGPWLLWPLAALFVLGVPAALLWAFASSVREDDGRAAEGREGAAGEGAGQPAGAGAPAPREPDAESV